MEKKLCSVEGCSSPIHARGWCNRHYRQDVRLGGSDYPPLPPLRDRVEPRIIKDDPSGCWLWPNKPNGDGYSTIDERGRRLLLHRLVLSWYIGPLPSGVVVDHRCFNRACCNPDHLRLATDKQNIENRSGLNQNNTSGYRGVTRTKSGRWRVQVGHARERISVGRFDTLEEANEAAIAARNALFTHNDLDRVA